MAIEEREPEAEYQEDRSVLGTLMGMWGQTWEKGPREGDGTPTGGPACILGENDGPTVNRHPGVGVVHLQQIKTGWPHGDHKQNRVKKKGRKRRRSPGKERRFERGGGGQPLGPLEIKAPLTLVGVPSRINNGNSLGRYRETMEGVANGRLIVRNSHHWGRRRQRIGRSQ